MRKGQPLRQTTLRASYNRQRAEQDKLYRYQKSVIRQQYRTPPRTRKRRRNQESTLFAAVIFPILWWSLKKIFFGIKWIIQNATQSLRERHQQKNSNTFG